MRINLFIACRLKFLTFALCFLTFSGFAQTPEKNGAYLSIVGDCISCHTAPSGKPLAGGLKMNSPFGYVLTPNITPDLATGIGSWTKDDFFGAVHNGVSKKGYDLYPVMPFTSYTKVSRADVDAIYDYLKTVPPVSNPVQVNHLDFPFNIRSSMIVWRELFFKPGFFKPDPQQSSVWNRGAYLVEGLAHCAECHTPRNLMGAMESSKLFSGAAVDGWYALNLTSNIATGLGSWSAQDIANYLKTGSYPGKTTVLGPMEEVVHNSTSRMTDADLLAIATYLKSVPPSSKLNGADRKVDATKLEGIRLYVDNCSGCHQSTGKGIAKVIPPLAGNPSVTDPSGFNIVKVIIRGIQARDGYIPMPSFAAQLNDEEIAELANYIRTSWGNSASANVTSAIVKKIRANPGI